MALSGGDLQKMEELVRTVVREELVASRKKKAPARKRTDVELEYERKFIKAWNSLPGVRKVRGDTIPEYCRDAFFTRCRSRKWCEAVKPALKVIARDKFFQGDNDRQWKANVEYFFRPGNAEKLAERYEGSESDVPSGWYCVYESLVADPKELGKVKWEELSENLRDRISKFLEKKSNG